MKKLMIIGISVALSACDSGIDNYEYSLDYFEHDNGIVVGNTLGFSLYESVINSHYFDVFYSSKTLSSDYSVDYRDSVGKQVSDSSYSINREINKALIQCSDIKLNQGDIVSTVGRWDLLGRLYSTSFDYEISNKQKIAEIQSCADKAMAEIPLDLDILARFSADDRFEIYQSVDLDNQLSLIKSDGKLTFKELISAYRILDKNIEKNINVDFMKSK